MHACVAVYSAAYIGSDGKSRKPEEAGSTAGQTLKLTCVLFELKSVVRVFVCLARPRSRRSQLPSSQRRPSRSSRKDLRLPRPRLAKLPRVLPPHARHLQRRQPRGQPTPWRLRQRRQSRRGQPPPWRLRQRRRGHPPWRTCRRDSFCAYIYIYLTVTLKPLYRPCQPKFLRRNRSAGGRLRSGSNLGSLPSGRSGLSSQKDQARGAKPEPGQGKPEPGNDGLVWDLLSPLQKWIIKQNPRVRDGLQPCGRPVSNSKSK